jgi:hypothetical protein
MIRSLSLRNSRPVTVVIEQAGAFDPLVLIVDRRMWMASHGSQAISQKSPVGIKGKWGNYEIDTGIKPS